MNLLPILGLMLLGTELQAASKPCEELKAEIAAKLQARGVHEYQLEITNRRGGGLDRSRDLRRGQQGNPLSRGRAELPDTLPDDENADTAPLPEDERDAGPTSLPEPIRPLP